MLSDSGLSAKVTRAEELARYLEREINAQTFGPGERIGTKTELRQRFGVAVATVNEAVRLMESRGLVAARPGPGGGVFVSSVDGRARAGHVFLGLNWGHATLSDCVELRMALEPVICRHAARSSSADDVQRLHAWVDEMEHTFDDVHAYLRVNWGYHRQAAAVCTNAPLQSVYLTLIDILEAGLDDFGFGRADEESVSAHRELAHAIGEGEGERLERAVERHAAVSPLPTDVARPRLQG